MKPPIFIPPAQAEALYDTQEDQRVDLRIDERLECLPWRDEDGSEELFTYSLVPPISSDLRRHVRSA